MIKKNIKYFLILLIILFSAEATASIDNKIIVSKTKKENRYFKQRTMKDSFINFNELTAKEVFNKFRACEKPYEAFYFDLNKKIIIKNLKILRKNDN